MTAIVGVLNSQGIAIAADSAATVSTGNIKKVYNKSNKLFTLSKYHPVGIAIYNSSQFLGIPWETLIKMYRKQLKDKKFDTVEKYKMDFLAFLSKNLDYVTQESREGSFYIMCSGDFNGLNGLKAKISTQLSLNEAVTSVMTPQLANTYITPIILQELQDYKTTIDSIPKNALITITLADYITEYGKCLDWLINNLEEHIKLKYPLFTFKSTDKDLFREIFYGVMTVEGVFEQGSGLIFIGFGDKEVYPSSHEVTIGGLVKNQIRYQIQPPTMVLPGKTNAEIISYAQRDVTMTVLKGIDPNYQKEIESSLTESFKTLSEEVVLKIPDATIAAETAAAIAGVADTLIAKLEKKRHETITQPLIDILHYMGKEDMADLAESLVSITSLKRKFTLNSSDESVGGPVDVAVITKGDGFVWIKRKNYFDFELNRGFMDKYYN